MAGIISKGTYLGWDIIQDENTTGYRSITAKKDGVEIMEDNLPKIIEKITKINKQQPQGIFIFSDTRLSFEEATLTSQDGWYGWVINSQGKKEKITLSRAYFITDKNKAIIETIKTQVAIVKQARDEINKLMGSMDFVQEDK